MGHFRIFGCLTYSHVPYEKRTKLHSTAKKGIFVAYDETSKGYQIYIPTWRQTVVRRDARFEEERAFRKSFESEYEEKWVSSPQVSTSHGTTT